MAMKRLIVVLMLLLTTACAPWQGTLADKEDRVSEEPTATEVAPLTVAELDYLFVTYVREDFAWADYVDDEELVGMGHEACAILGSASPTSARDIVVAVQGHSAAMGFSPAYAPNMVGLIGSAIPAYCPQWLHLVE